MEASSRSDPPLASHPPASGDSRLSAPAPPERKLSGDQLPPRLRDLDGRCPELIYLRGELPRGPTVGIVGTRRCTPEAAGFARELAGELACAGVAILSGGALGIDTAAHQGALDVAAPTVVIAPASFSKPYPPENRDLFHQVLECGGAYLSAEHVGEAAARHKFFLRNAILAALAHALIIVECPMVSGARNAASTARKLGRPIFVVPGVPWNPRAQGCIHELSLGARPLFSHRDIERWLASARLHPIPLPPERREGIHQLQLPPPGRESAPAPRRSRADPGGCKSETRRVGPSRKSRHPARPRDPTPPPHAVDTDSDSGRVVSAIRAGAAYPDDVCDRTGLSPPLVQHLLLRLTLEGVVSSDRSGRIRLVGGTDC